MQGRAELVTYLSEGLLVPLLLLEPNLVWSTLDARSAHATLWHGDNVVTGVFRFDDDGDRACFETFDRWRDGPKRPTQQRWSAEVGGFELQGGVRVPRHTRATWHAPEGDFEYMRGSVESITTDVTGACAALPVLDRLRGYLAARGLSGSVWSDPSAGSAPRGMHPPRQVFRRPIAHRVAIIARKGTVAACSQPSPRPRNHDGSKRSRPGGRRRSRRAQRACGAADREWVRDRDGRGRSASFVYARVL